MTDQEIISDLNSKNIDLQAENNELKKTLCNLQSRAAGFAHSLKTEHEKTERLEKDIKKYRAAVFAITELLTMALTEDK